MKISIGEGLNSNRIEVVEVENMHQLFGALPTKDEGHWLAAEYANGTRTKDNWVGSELIAIDVDYGSEHSTPTPSHRSIAASMKTRANAQHHTPRGIRMVYRIEYTTDPATWIATAEQVAAECREDFSRAGIGGPNRYYIDDVSSKLTQLYFSPRIDTGDRARNFPVLIHHDDVWKPRSKLEQIAAAVLYEAACKIEAAKPGTRNETLNAQAFAIGQRVGAGLIDEATARATLEHACAGWEEQSKTRGTLESGFSSGMAQPLSLPAAVSTPAKGKRRRVPMDKFQTTATGKIKSTPYNRNLIVEAEMSYVWQLNKLTGDIIAMEDWEGDHPIRKGEMLRDEHITALEAQISREYEVTFSQDHLLRSVELQALEHSFHPLQDYLSSIVWDRVPRLENWLVTYMHAEDTEVTRFCGKSFLIQAAARALDPGCKADYTLILEGDQGHRKSEAVKLLFGDEYVFDGRLNLRDKDSCILTSKNWCVQLDEISAMHQHHPDELKAFLTARGDKVRAPYQRRAIYSPRCCVFIGTTNDQQYLRDSTGNRRIWGIGVSCIDTISLLKDRDQLWAEAVLEYRSGATWWPTTDEQVRMLEISVESRREKDPWEDALLPWSLEHSSGTISDALVAIGKSPAECDRKDQRRMAKVLRAIGYHKKHTMAGNIWTLEN